VAREAGLDFCPSVRLRVERYPTACESDTGSAGAREMGEFEQEQLQFAQQSRLERFRKIELADGRQFSANHTHDAWADNPFAQGDVE
jgi:hypothetical protein